MATGKCICHSCLTHPMQKHMPQSRHHIHSLLSFCCIEMKTKPFGLPLKLWLCIQQSLALTGYVLLRLSAYIVILNLLKESGLVGAEAEFRCRSGSETARLPFWSPSLKRHVPLGSSQAALQPLPQQLHQQLRPSLMHRLPQDQWGWMDPNLLLPKALIVACASP